VTEVGGHWSGNKYISLLVELVEVMEVVLLAAVVVSLLVEVVKLV